MTAGYNGRIAVFWSQTEIDGLEAAPLSDLVVGATLALNGRVVHLPQSEAELAEQTEFAQAMTILAGREQANAAFEPVARLTEVSLTNGAQRFQAALMMVVGESDPVLVFENGCPARGVEFWVSAIEDPAQALGAEAGRSNVVAFPPRRDAGSPLVLSRRMTVAAAE